MQVGDLVSVRRYGQMGIITWVSDNGRFIKVLGQHGNELYCYEEEGASYVSEWRYNFT